MSKNKLLIVAAHPDDEILGCGGTASKLIREGWEAYTLILGEGVTSRDGQRDVDARKADLGNLRHDLLKANEIIGVKEVFTCAFPDNRFDTVALLDIVKEVEKIKNKIKPSMIFTHFGGDLNIDHQICQRAVLTATRPMTGETVKEIYSFEVLSSTEWMYPPAFCPTVFFDISADIKNKQSAMSAYQKELCEFPHPRSLRGIEISAQNWGLKIGVPFAEAFVPLRIIK